MVEVIDGKWGEGRELSELLKDNELPELYFKINYTIQKERIKRIATKDISLELRIEKLRDHQFDASNTETTETLLSSVIFLFKALKTGDENEWMDSNKR